MIPDDLDDLLTPGGELPGDARREEVWRQTSGYLRRRKRVRDVVRVGGAVLLVALGVGAGWMLKPAGVPTGPGEVTVARREPTASAPAATTSPSPRTAQQLELDAERVDDLMASARLYREAGDRYLEQGNDIRSALRCYRQHLELTDQQARQVSVNDSWLLLSLKRAHSEGDLQ